jgi:hypothetical protein
MKMARASNADIDAALAVSRILEDLERRHMPCDDKDSAIEWFDRDDAEQCKRALGMLLDAAARGSIFRVTFGMTVVLDPRNELLDPDADTLEKHPKTMAALEVAAATAEAPPALPPATPHPNVVHNLTRERDGWREQAETLQKSLHSAQCDLDLLRANQAHDVWIYQGDGEDHLESMSARMVVVIFAADLRALLPA